MRPILTLLALSMLLLSAAYPLSGQGTIRGKIIDEMAEPIYGVTIVLKSDPSIGTTTDFDGNYSLVLQEGVDHTIVISYIGYRAIETNVSFAEKKVVILNFEMEEATEQIGEVEITTKRVKSNDFYLERQKQKSVTSIDYISSEIMKRTGDANVVSAVARVSGVSTFGGLITVRGIGDRYIKTTVNGSTIPTLDPFTNNIRLDLFPSSLVDNIVLTKTASADLSGEWTGAYLSVLTKDFPDQLTVNASVSVGYNSQATFQNMLASDRSPTDWLGFDNGFRDIDHDAFVPVTANPTQYEEYKALGLESYFGSLGVDRSWTPTSSYAEEYTRLALVELGLLGPALFNNNEAVSEAKEMYNSEYKGSAYRMINEEAVESSKSLSNNWNTYYRRAIPNISQSFTVGNQVNLFNRPLGFIFGYRYENKRQYDPFATANVASVDAQGERFIEISSTRELGREINGWSALANLSYKIAPNHNISLMFMPNFRGVNSVQDAVNDNESETYATLLNKTQFYEERQQLVYQYASEHFFPGSKFKLNANASYTRGKSTAPDFKFLTFFADTDGQYIIDNTESDTHRYFRYLDEDQFDSRIEGELPVAEKPGLPRKIKFGGSYQFKNREFNQYDYRVIYNTNVLPVDSNDFDAFFAPEQFEITDDNSINRYYQEAQNPANRTFGSKQVLAGFAMVDYTIIPALRVSAGLRVEHADIQTDVFAYDTAGYLANDPRRQYPGDVFLVNPANLNELSFLPSANVIFKLVEDTSNLVNLRLNYSNTVARPSIRELSDVIVLDFELRDFVFGNADLQMVNIHNYDLRLESYFNRKHSASFSLFYKDFTNHIELINTNQGFTWQNVDESRVVGIELEGKTEIIRGLELRGNVTVVNSKTEFVRSRLEIVDGAKNFVPLDTVSRSMFGQAPYILNGILSYSPPRLGLTAAVSYNIQGSKLVLASFIEGVPDIFELPQHRLDLKVSKSLDRKQQFQASFKIRNILDQTIRRSYKYDDGEIIDFDSFSPGVTYEVGLSFNLVN